MTETADARRGSWTRRLARRVMGPFVATPLRPNHITTIRIAAGVAACAGFATGTVPGNAWGGALWVLSAFLDRCDGEYARMTGSASRFGRIYDFAGDVLVNSAVFLAIGMGLRNPYLAGWAIPLACLAAAGVAVASATAEWNERDMPPGVKTFPGALGFDFDDLIYLITPLAWIDSLDLVLVGGAVGAPVAAAVVAAKAFRNARQPGRRHHHRRT